MSKLPRSQTARTGVVGSTAARIGLQKLKTKAKRPFLSDEAQQRAEDRSQDIEAELLFGAITQLRGTAVKLAQMLGMESELLPPRVADELSKAYHQIPPLNRVLVSKVITEELGRSPDALFSHFDTKATAAASLGQVHRAQTQAGKQVAVKVQYPGINVTIESDLKLLRKLATSSRLYPGHIMPKQAIVDQTIKEVSDRLREETDYLLEADNTQWFHNNLQVDGVVAPNAYPEFSARRVITTEWLDGQHLTEWLKNNPSQESRNRVGQRLYDLFLFSTNTLKCVHADPNPGNYLFREDDSIALIDFGCVKRLSDQFVENLPALLLAFSSGDYNQIMSAYAELGMTIRSNDLPQLEKVLKPFAEWMSLPFQQEYFDFSEHQDYTSKGHQLIHDLSHMQSVETVAEDFIFFDRTFYGLFKVLERLQARVYIRHHWETLWN